MSPVSKILRLVWPVTWTADVNLLLTTILYRPIPSRPAHHAPARPIPSPVVSSPVPSRLLPARHCCVPWFCPLVLGGGVGPWAPLSLVFFGPLFRDDSQDLEVHPCVAPCPADDVPPPSVAVLGPGGRDAAGPPEVQGVSEPEQEPGQAGQGSFVGLGKWFVREVLRGIYRSQDPIS